jgi:RNA polymerase sigma factor (sigma-70 family)
MIAAVPASQPRWVLTQESFDRLLASFGADRQSAVQQYLEARRKLVRFFEWRGCPFPEDHADETFDRVARRLAEGQTILNPAGYCFGVARMLLLEINKEVVRQQQKLRELSGSTITAKQSDESEARIDRLRQCLQKLSPDDRELILQYYHGEKGVKIDCRKKLAERFGVSTSTLRMRALRIRENLQRCFANSPTHCRSNCSNRSLVNPVLQWKEMSGDNPASRRMPARCWPERFDQEGAGRGKVKGPKGKKGGRAFDSGIFALSGDQLRVKPFGIEESKA